MALYSPYVSTLQYGGFGGYPSPYSSFPVGQSFTSYPYVNTPFSSYALAQPFGLDATVTAYPPVISSDFGIPPPAEVSPAFGIPSPQGLKVVVAGSAKAYAEFREKAVESVLKLQEETRKEPGCIAYHWTQSLEDPDEFIIYEHWESDEHLAKHLDSEHVKEFKDAVPDLFVEDPKVQKTAVLAFEEI